MQKILLEKLARNINYLKNKDFLSIYLETGYLFDDDENKVTEIELITNILSDFDENNIIPSYNTYYFDGYYKYDENEKYDNINKYNINSYFDSKKEGIPVNRKEDADFAFFINIENSNDYYKVYLDKELAFRESHTVIDRKKPKYKEENYYEEYYFLHYQFFKEKASEYLEKTKENKDLDEENDSYKRT